MGGLDEPEDPLSYSQCRYKNDDEDMKKKMKNLQAREEQRQKFQQDEYLRRKQEDDDTKKAKKQKKKQVKTVINNENEEEQYAWETENSEDHAARVLKEQAEEGFDAKDLQETLDGWEFYKRKRIPQTMVRRYCQTLD